VAVADEQHVVEPRLARRPASPPQPVARPLGVLDRGVEGDPLPKVEVVHVVVEVLQQLTMVREVGPVGRHRIVLDASRHFEVSMCRLS